MVDRLDPYPSRLTEYRAPLPRREPVVHSRNQRRWEGPLDEVASTGTRTSRPGTPKTACRGCEQ